MFTVDSKSQKSGHSSGSDEERRKRTKKESKIEKNFEALKSKFEEQWPEYKLRAWATMVVRESNCATIRLVGLNLYILIMIVVQTGDWES